MGDARGRGIDLGGLRVATQAGRLRFAILPIVSPGATALLLSGGEAPSPPRAPDFAALVQSVLGPLRQGGLALAQLLIEPTEAPLIEAYVACGFERMAELIYLGLTVRQAPPVDLPPGFVLAGWSEPTRPLFAQAIAESYRDSLDCPRLTGLRTMDEVIASHQASGVFAPEGWTVLMEGDRPVGVCLVNRASALDSVELVYLGLAPSVRGRGLGAALFRHALGLCQRLGDGRLMLAVDAKNHPAQKLYYRYGMHRICCRAAMLNDLRGARRRILTACPQAG